MTDGSASVAPLSRRERYRATRLATIVAAVVNSLLAVTQIVSGWLFQSQALIADGVHTLSDLVSDGVVLVAARKASASPDRDHPYGHGRIETLATVVVGVMLAIAALGIGWFAVQRLLDWELMTGPAPAALAFAVLTLVAKEGLYQYTVRVARRIGSPLLHANAWHHRSDAISSLVVLVGIGGAVAGWPWLDAVAALVVALFILRMAWRLVFKSAAELIDTALEPEQVATIRDAIAGVPGVKSAHMLRTRRLGNEAAADVHIQVAPKISVSEGHQIADEVYRAVMASLPALRDVTVHVDPENDEEQLRSVGLPLRPEITECLRAAWHDAPELAAVEQVGLHYLGGRVHVTVTLRLDDEQAGAELNRRAVELAELLRQRSDFQDQLGQILILFRARTSDGRP
ncbi:cation diffusion facilitator family transporter [Thioalkalivibrio paradoxus]|uniref:Cation transporter n=1 Tax=Thioalkalivibrio paradoxus ARh 1 TaxID=713585 RepID=W0DER1_9GAMM|nr:cation diffusion facilitator family transporter [Thioalkalivibrio paradoxus]AHE97129.1 cation transporter [Thioalkalivibrio paradoxus ARh 1]